MSDFVTEELGLRIEHISSPVGRRLEDLVHPGLRKNPKRAHLLVSTVLGKHIPVPPSQILDAGGLLATLCADVLDDTEAVVVLGFAETATGLGHTVADSLGARAYLHSTRRHVSGVEVFAQFQEGHSHATDHRLLPVGADVLREDLPLVLVDDELSTGATALRTIEALHATAPRAHYVLASLVDLREDRHLAEVDVVAERLGVRIDSVTLARGRVVLPTDLVAAVSALPQPAPLPPADVPGIIDRIDIDWPAAVPDGGRHLILGSESREFHRAIANAAETLEAHLEPHQPLVVIGHEELMYLPLRIARLLETAGRETLFQTSTRSPAHVIDRPGYPLRRGFTFAAAEFDESGNRYLYNAQFDDPRFDPRYVVIADSAAATDSLWSGLVTALAATGAHVTVVVIPVTNPTVLASTRDAQ